MHAMSLLLISMQEMERKRIACDLHDSLGQSLSALSCGIGAALESARKDQSKTTSARLEALAGQVRAAIVEVQRIAMNLRPPMLDDIGLVATLTWFVREFAALHPQLALTTEIDIDEGDVALALRTPIFRIVQEASNNIGKHSAASAMHLRLQRANGEVRLLVSDNGIGFMATNGGRALFSVSGMGLKGMRERAECSGGRFRLASTPGRGTRVAVAWPAAA
jgi:signal transduction histidine kinase